MYVTTVTTQLALIGALQARQMGDHKDAMPQKHALAGRS